MSSPYFLGASGEGVELDKRFNLPVSHPYFILSPPVDDWIVICNFTSIDADTSPTWQTIALQEGEHPVVKHPTCVPTPAFKLVRHSKLVGAVNHVKPATYSRLAPELHAKILIGFLKCKHRREEVAKFLLKHFGPTPFDVVSKCVIPS